MTPKEASIELEQAIALIYDALNRNNDDDTWSELTAAVAHLRKVQSAFTGPLCNKPRPLHPPSVPAPPARTELINLGKFGIDQDPRLPHGTGRSHVYSISGCARPLGRLE